MTLFEKGLLAHLIADWILQNDWMAREKGHHPTGPACLLHCTIYTATVSLVYLAAATPPALPCWRLVLFALIIFTSHWLIDGLRLAERWGALLAQSPGPPVRTVVDQTMHLIVLALVSSV